MEIYSGVSKMTAQYSSKNLSEEMTPTIKEAIQKAILHHKAVGNKIAFWDKGKIVVEVPENIPHQEHTNNISKSK